MLRLYSETLPFEEIVHERTRSLLVRHPFDLVLAVRPWQLGELPRVVRTLEDAGVRTSVWPMLADDEGRWASAENAASFARLLVDTADALARGGAPVREVLLDLEPPFTHARALAMGGGGEGRLRDVAHVKPARPSRAVLDAAAAVLASAVAELHARGVATAAAVWPLVALDAPGSRGWQGLLGTPVDALGVQRVSVMVYTSILEGWSRGALARRHAQALLARATARSVTRWGAAGGVSLGCVGTGALDDEPVYRGAEELAEDVAVARAAGCSDLSLFDLGGVVRRGPPERWLDAFVAGGEAEVLAPSRRVALARVLARLATWALARRR